MKTRQRPVKLLLGTMLAFALALFASAGDAYLFSYFSDNSANGRRGEAATTSRPATRVG